MHAELSADKRATIATLAREAASDGQETAAELRKHITKRLAELDKQEDRYLDLIGDPEWPQDKIKARLQTTRQEAAKLRAQITDSGNPLDVGRDVILTALELLEHPQELYRLLSERAKKVLNQAVFNRLYLDFDTDPFAAGDELQEPFSTLLYARRSATLGKMVDGALERRSATLTTEDDASYKTFADLLASDRDGQSASRAAMVGTRGLEPPRSFEH